jgi:uncharacterized Zn finger protein
LSEDDRDVAWDAAHTDTCNQNLLIALAGKLAPVRAEEALVIYMSVIQAIVEQTNNSAYADAAKLIRKVERLMNARGSHREFGN